MRDGKNIVLCGFMGSGKTTLGRLLADALNMRFVDMDEWIEQQHGLSVPELFKQYGEDDFREREHEAILSLSGQGGTVISTGGGALTFSRNVQPLREKGTIVFLNPGFNACYGRICDSDRPLVRANTCAQLQSLYETRAAAYRAASEIELTLDAPPEECAARLCRMLCGDA